MNYPTLLWRHDVYCSEPRCGERVVREGDLSDMRNKDGTEYEPGISNMLVSGYFVVVCANGHENDVRAPRDATIMGGNPQPGLCDGPLVYIRSLMSL
jgi:hypothetical protein